MAEEKIYYSERVQGGWTWNLTQDPNVALPAGIKNVADGTYKIKSISLTLTRITNNNYPLYGQKKYNGVFTSIMASRGRIKSPNPFKINFTVDGKTSSTLTVSEIHEFSGAYTTTYNGTTVTGYGQQNSWINPSGDLYTFTFSDPPVVKSNSNLKLNYLDNCFTTGNTSGISVKDWTKCFVTVEKVIVPEPTPPDPPPEPTPPPAPTPTTTSIYCWVTDRNCTTPYNSESIKSNYAYQFRPSGIESDSNIDFSNGNYVSISGSLSNVTIEAQTNNTDYPTTDHCSITYSWPEISHTDEETGEEVVDRASGSKVYNITVSFYEKIKRQTGNWSIVTNARDLHSYSIPITMYDYSTPMAKSHYAFKNEKIIKNSLDGFDITTNNKNINLSQYFSISTTDNVFDIADDGISIPYLFRFINTDVYKTDYLYTVANTYNAYKQDLNLDLTIYCAPTNAENRFSYNYLDRNNNPVPEDTLPDVVLLNQEDIIVSNLYYENLDPEDGYCRAFYCYFRDEKTKRVTNSFILYSSDDTDGVFNGKILKLNDSVYKDIPKNQILELVIEPSFYFDDNDTEMYSKTEYVIPKKFLKIDDSEFIPKLIFPALNKTSPYTTMMLTNVERFGYEFPLLLQNNWSRFNCRFGIKLNDYKLYLDEIMYFSGSDVTYRLLFNIGLFIAKQQMFIDNVDVRPFVDTLVGLPQQLTIIYGYNQGASFKDSENIEHSNICTTKETMWLSPIAKRGEYLEYFDNIRFENYINKYKFFNYNLDWKVETNPQMQGRIIDTDFWLEKRRLLEETYQQKMYNWITDSHNKYINNIDNICWKLPVFDHIKGEYFLVKNVPATHDYLNAMKYSHNYLHNFTYNEVKLLGRKNNLKQNYYDLLNSLNVEKLTSLYIDKYNDIYLYQLDPYGLSTL